MAKSAAQTSRMRRFSTLSGRFSKLPRGKKYEVGFKNLTSYDRLFYRSWTKIVAAGALLVVLAFNFMLFQPSHWIAIKEAGLPGNHFNWVMLACLVLLQVFLIVGTFSATRSTLKAKNPLPVRPQPKLKVAFVTTRAPGEPLSMVETTLRAIKNVTYKSGTIDVWLLDETNEPALKKLCRSLGVKHFSRAGKPEWNTAKPSHYIKKRSGHFILWLLSFGRHKRFVKPARPDTFLAARSKHGNFNSWRQYLKKRKIQYDILAGVDTDHVPEPNYLERMLGYFRDPDVAYVVGPQVYGNYRSGLGGLVARWAESQASFFQSTVQRAGNASTSAMFVGTNYTVRMSVLDQINGFQPCITEDMATGMAVHAKRNPATGNRWKSVYTPDVLAVGEGPDFWGPYFTQQWRWSAGAFDTWRRMVGRLFFKWSFKANIHYFLMLTFYPIAALTWLLGIVSSTTYLITGATAIIAPWGQFISLYMMSVVMQLSLYFWNRRFNVSPHEPENSYGIAGMMLSTLAAPIYLSALIGMLLGKKPHFVVTTKGSGDNPDWLPAFKIHLQWAVLLIAASTYGLLNSHNHPAMLLWVGGQLVVCLTPFVLGMSLALPYRFKKLMNSFKARLSVRKEQNA